MAGEMTEAQKILSLIESVDPNNDVLTNQINVAVQLYLDQIETLAKHGWWVMKGSKSYTESRDILKAIRPDGWDFEWRNYGKINNELLVRYAAICPEKHFVSPKMTSEELAELHVIIQSIAYERTK